MNTFPLRSESAPSIILSSTAHGGQAPSDVITFASSYLYKTNSQYRMLFLSVDNSQLHLIELDRYLS